MTKPLQRRVARDQQTAQLQTLEQTMIDDDDAEPLPAESASPEVTLAVDWLKFGGYSSSECKILLNLAVDFAFTRRVKSHPQIKKCKECSKPYLKRESTKLFCSETCKQAWNYKKRKERI